MKSVLGDGMLLDEDCNEILHTLSDLLINHNLSMRKQAATEAMLEEKLASLDGKEKVAAMNNPKQLWFVSSSTKRQYNGRKERQVQFYHFREW